MTTNKPPVSPRHKTVSKTKAPNGAAKKTLGLTPDELSARDQMFLSAVRGLAHYYDAADLTVIALGLHEAPMDEHLRTLLVRLIHHLVLETPVEDTAKPSVKPPLELLARQLSRNK
jgi:hypothetical protein